MRQYTFEVAVATIAVLSIAATTSALNHFLKPVSKNSREASNRRIVWVVLPTVFLFFTVWCFGSAYEGGISFFRRFEVKLNYAIQNQDEIKDGIDSAKSDIKTLRAEMQQVKREQQAAKERGETILKYTKPRKK